jgi:diaminohydroxyphosphoribosylaminopyrimidine deaminase/5-amino-6-(5-phosphoribosylamino)uracil reductase
MSESAESPEHSAEDVQWIQRAIELARRGQGLVEPNPMVGCVLVRDGKLIGEGYHQGFGQAHAEVNAIVACEQTEGATAYVTLEPCSHHGKTPPCSQALIQAGIKRVVVAQVDPFPEVAGAGIHEMRDAGIEVVVGVLEDEARRLNAAYLKRVQSGLPWMIGKYAMTLDGKIATGSGDSQWISSEASREIVHRIRGRVDAVLIGANTAAADDPMLNARPPGKRVARRLVVDSQLRLDLESRLARTAREIPVEVCCGAEPDQVRAKALEDMGVVINVQPGDRNERLMAFLKSQVTDHGATNILVEGGGHLLGSLRDVGQLDELHVFIGPKMIGGSESIPPVTGEGVDLISDASQFQITSTQIIGGDVYLRAQRTDNGEAL